MELQKQLKIATREEMLLAELLIRQRGAPNSNDDIASQKQIKKFLTFSVVELANCTASAAELALIDCEGSVEAAVALLLDGGSRKNDASTTETKNERGMNGRGDSNIETKAIGTFSSTANRTDDKDNECIELPRRDGEDLSPERDGTITKSILVAGEKHNCPSENAPIKVHAVGSDLNGRIFYDRELEYVLGEGSAHQLPEGVDKALRRQNKAEKSRVMLKGQFGYGEKPPAEFGLAANETIVFTLFLKDFEIKPDLELLEEENKAPKKFLDQALTMKKRPTAYSCFMDLRRDEIGWTKPQLSDSIIKQIARKEWRMMKEKTKWEKMAAALYEDWIGEYEVLRIVNKRTKDEKVQYLVNWKNFPKNTWEDEENLNCPRLLQEFEAEQMGIDEILLAPLPMKIRTRRRHLQHLIIDDKIELTKDEMMHNMDDFGDIVRSREDLHTEIMRMQMPTLDAMLDPVPRHILAKELYPLFQTVLKDIHERALTFAEASRMTYDEMCVRRFEFFVAEFDGSEDDDESPPEPINMGGLKSVHSIEGLKVRLIKDVENTPPGYFSVQKSAQQQAEEEEGEQESTTATSDPSTIRAVDMQTQTNDHAVVMQAQINDHAVVMQTQINDRAVDMQTQTNEADNDEPPKTKRGTRGKGRSGGVARRRKREKLRGWKKEDRIEDGS